MRCFTVTYDQLNGILSPLFFISQPQNTKGFVPLNTIAFVNPNRPTPQISLDAKVPYVGLPETDNGKITEVLQRPYREVKGRNHFIKDDVLFARIEPSVFNQKYIYADDLRGNDYAFTSTEFYIVKAKEKTDPKFIFYMLFTDQVFEQIKGKTTGSTGRRRLDKSAFEKTLIPYPDKETRAKVVEILENAYKQREKKLKQADELLGSIDDFVRQQLGIDYKEPEEEKIYTVNLADIKDNRIDPYFHKPQFKQLFKSLTSGKYKAKELKEVSTAIFQGVGKDEVTNPNFVLLKVKNILPNQDIDYENVEYVKNPPKAKLLRKNDIISPFIGEAVRLCKFSVFNKEDISYTVDNNTGVIRLDETKAKGRYVATVLNSQIGKLQLDRLIGGGAVPFLGSNNAGLLLIPLPSLKHQEKIASEVENILGKSKTLKTEASKLLEEAKKKVEAMILN